MDSAIAVCAANLRAQTAPQHHVVPARSTQLRNFELLFGDTEQLLHQVGACHALLAVHLLYSTLCILQQYGMTPIPLLSILLVPFF